VSRVSRAAAAHRLHAGGELTLIPAQIRVGATAQRLRIYAKEPPAAGGEASKIGWVVCKRAPLPALDGGWLHVVGETSSNRRDLETADPQSGATGR